MAFNKTVTFREQTVGNISDFIEDEGLQCQASQVVLSYLVGALLSYREEGILLTPNVLFCGNAEEVFKAFPGTVKYRIGEAPLSHSAAKRILKDCAPLTTANWSIYIERKTADIVEYGIFRYTKTPTSLPLDDAITMSSASLCILLRKTSGSTIGLLGSKGSALSLVFSTTREAAPQSSAVGDFAKDCCASVAGNHAAKFSEYFKRLVADALVRTHGTIMACTNLPDLNKIPQLSDHVSLTPALDLNQAFVEYVDSNSAEAALALQSCEELLQGFMNSDGIVVVDAKAKVIAYRCFYRGEASQKQPAPQATGGARMRAYEGVKTLLGASLSSVLFRSQDGLTLCDRSPK